MRESEGEEGTRPAARLLDERPRGGAAGNQLLAQVRNGGVDEARLHSDAGGEVQGVVAGGELVATRRHQNARFFFYFRFPLREYFLLST